MEFVGGMAFVALIVFIAVKVKDSRDKKSDRNPGSPGGGPRDDLEIR